MTDYRVKEARVECCDGSRFWHERRFGAERRIRFLWVLSFWFPVLDFAWRRSHDEAMRDIEHDAELRAPLGHPTYVTIHREGGA